MQAACHHIADLLCHEPVGGELATKDGQKPVQALACVVAYVEAARGLSSCCAARCVEGPCAGKDAQYAEGVYLWEQGTTKVQKAQGLVRGGACVCGIFHCLARGAEYGHGAVGHKDITVRALVQPVYHMVCAAVVEDNESALVRGEGHVQACQGGYHAGPGTCGVHDDFAGHVELFAGPLVHHIDTCHAAVFLMNGRDLVVGVEFAAVALGTHGVVQDKTKAVHCSVRDLEDAAQVGVQARLKTQGLVLFQFPCLYACSLAALDPLVHISRIVLVREHKEAFSLVNALSAYAPQDGVFAYALCSCFPVAHSVAAATVQKAVKARACAVAQSALLEKHGRYAAHGQVSQYACACGATTYDNHCCPV